MSQISTWLRITLMAITVWPTTTPIKEMIRMTSMARSRSAGVRSASSAVLGKAICGFTHRASLIGDRRRVRSSTCLGCVGIRAAIFEPRPRIPD
ncbi:hypothetical protein [Mycobacterium sp.]|uniref:hypothetical protein n=1 Tax=Mycobacterium sp. TaxID=1785 RepID=UPI003F9DD312